MEIIPEDNIMVNFSTMSDGSEEIQKSEVVISEYYRNLTEINDMFLEDMEGSAKDSMLKAEDASRDLLANMGTILKNLSVNLFSFAQSSININNQASVSAGGKNVKQ